MTCLTRPDFGRVDSRCMPGRRPAGASVLLSGGEALLEVLAA